MESSISIIFHLYIQVVLVVLVSSSSSHYSSLEKTRRRCHDEEKAALLQFKHSFPSTNQCNNGVHQKPKLESWKEGGDCCSWEGVECDEQTDHYHVIGLDLSQSCLFGSINSSSSLFTLTHLQRLDLSYNDFNYSHIPSAIGNLSRLTHLHLTESNFSGQIPQQQLSNITTMVSLDLSSYSGLELHSLKGLVQHMSNLKHLHLSEVNLSSSGVPHLLSNLSSLESLDLLDCELKGEFPMAIFDLPKLKMLDISGNRDFKGYLPNFRSGSPLQTLSFFGTSFGGVLPPSIGNLTSLKELYMDTSNFTGDLMSLGNLTQLVFLGIWGGNHVTPDTLNTSSLSWIGKLTKLTDLSLQGLDLTGSLPIPPPSTTSTFSSYLISNNSLSGELSPLICNFIFLVHLDLAFNSLSGKLPQCLSSFSNSLLLLDVRGNKFDGNIPSMWRNGCQLRMIDMSYNQLQGQLPRSLTNCSQLEFVDFGNNQIRDTFPFWSGRLAMLSVLKLQSNQFHGELNNDFGSSNLRVIDLSNNRFKGKLPSKFINTSKPMRALNTSHTTNYMELDLHPTYRWGGEDFGIFDYSVILHNKGLEINYVKIPTILCTIDFSSNNFEGVISDVYGDLTGLQVLNLSRNHLIGNIPSSFSSMKNLESLDLSLNHLSGQIPMELTKLTSLSSFNVSFNNLSGPIPQGNQFCTFDSKSYEGNPGLSFETWNKQCGNARSLPQLQQAQSPTEDDDDEDVSKIKWMIISIGFVSGLAVGVILGNELTTRKYYWRSTATPKAAAVCALGRAAGSSGQEGCPGVVCNALPLPIKEQEG
ncbi:unnamed protein product [Cuscuta campestris]|uniref:Uncharacterized protein n=1 Tax=Cuscuta campestris TaxID=132261 RepID=A0A484KRZ9_9ASTE|nr:unnamed protein product [Cuscuta campestris]